MSALGILTRGYIDEVRPATADIPAFPSAKAQDDGINVNQTDAPTTVIEAKDGNVNVKQEDKATTVLPSDPGTIIKIIPC